MENKHLEVENNQKKIWELSTKKVENTHKKIFKTSTKKTNTSTINIKFQHPNVVNKPKKYGK